LRYLQTLTEIAAEHNSTIVFPLPIDLLRGFLEGPPRNGIVAERGEPAGQLGRADSPA
jgi:hypothetical protein